MTAAVLAGLRLWAMGRRASGVFGTLSSAMLGLVAFLMPLELAFFASFDNRQSIVDMLADVFTEPWFLMAWGGLMALTLIPAGLQAAALWLAVPHRVHEPAPRPDPPEARE